MLCSSCIIKPPADNKINLDNAKYIVSFSGYDRSNFRNAITAVYNDGSANEYKLNTSMGIENVIKDSDSYKFFSRQTDVHYKVSSNGIEEFNLLDDDTAGGFYGVFSASLSDNTALQIVNIGSSDKGYLMKLVLSDTEKRTFDFYEKILCNAIKQGNSIILSYIDLTSNYKNGHAIGRSKLAVFDLEKAEIVSEVELPTVFRVEPDVKMVHIDGNIIFFTNKLSELSTDFDGESYLGVYSIADNSLADTVTMPNMNILQIFEYNSQLVIVEADGKINIYDKDLTKKESNSIDLVGEIHKVRCFDDTIYFATMDNDSNVFITSYNLNDKTVEKTNVPVPKSIKWDGGGLDFCPL